MLFNNLTSQAFCFIGSGFSLIAVIVGTSFGIPLTQGERSDGSQDFESALGGEFIDWAEEAFEWMSARSSTPSGSVGELQVNNHLLWGKTLEYAHGEPQDLVGARKEYEKAAELSEAAGHLQFGHMLAHGIGGEADDAEARAHYKLGAGLGNMEARVHYGYMLRAGTGGPKDLDEARRQFKTAARQGHIKAQLFFATMLEAGEGGKKDLSLAREQYKLASDADDPDAQVCLGAMMWSGIGGPKDLSRALIYLKKAADQKHMLGVARYWGIMRKSRLVYCPLIAREMFRVRAEAGDASSQASYGSMVERGLGGYTDISEALHWYNLSAQQKYPIGMMKYGYAKLNPKFGPVDHDEAHELIRLAHEKLGSQEHKIFRILGL